MIPPIIYIFYVGVCDVAGYRSISHCFSPSICLIINRGRPQIQLSIFFIKKNHQIRILAISPTRTRHACQGKQNERAPLFLCKKNPKK